MDGGEVAQATCKEQPFDVGFHPTSGVFVAGLITGEVRAASRVARRPAADARRRGKNPRCRPSHTPRLTDSPSSPCPARRRRWRFGIMTRTSPRRAA